MLLAAWPAQRARMRELDRMRELPRARSWRAPGRARGPPEARGSIRCQADTERAPKAIVLDAWLPGISLLIRSETDLPPAAAGGKSKSKKGQKHPFSCVFLTFFQLLFAPLQPGQSCGRAGRVPGNNIDILFFYYIILDPDTILRSYILKIWSGLRLRF